MAVSTAPGCRQLTVTPVGQDKHKGTVTLCMHCLLTVISFIKDCTHKYK